MASNTWRLWDYSPEKIFRFINNVKYRRKKDAYILCPEEAYIDEWNAPNWANNLESDTINFHVIFGAYDYDWYKKNFSAYSYNNVSLKLWEDFWIYRSIVSPQSFPYIKTKDIQSLFICLCNHGHLHRVQFMDHLAEANLLKNNFYSWHDDMIPVDVLAQHKLPKFFDMKKKLLDGTES